MLDKLNYFKASSEISFANTANGIGNVADSIKALYAKSGFQIRLDPATKGTLGVTFKCYGLPEGPCFIKSHLPGKKYMDLMEKEGELLGIANEGRLKVKPLYFGVEDSEYLCLQMDILHEIQEMTPVSVCNLIKEYQDKLANVTRKNMYDMEALWCSAWTELDNLYEKKFLSDFTYQRARKNLLHLQDSIPSLERCICHGDLSDKNIMMNEARYSVVIDWEDAFWGCAEYDYLYWLTFFNHRRFYKCGKKVLMDIAPERAVSLMTLIIILKCAISFYSGSYRGHSMSMEKRMTEIWKVWGETG